MAEREGDSSRSPISSSSEEEEERGTTVKDLSVRFRCSFVL
jgi:hypothetical protein